MINIYTSIFFALIYFFFCALSSDHEKKATLLIIGNMWLIASFILDKLQ